MATFIKPIVTEELKSILPEQLKLYQRRSVSG